MAGGDGLGDLVAARERTVAAGSARIELVRELVHVPVRWDPPLSPSKQFALDAAKAAGRGLLRLVSADLAFRRQAAEGVLDLARRRYMIDFHAAAALHSGGRTWSGRSGRAISTLPAEEEPIPTPLWLLDLLAGAKDAVRGAAEAVRATPCHRLTVVVDAGAASRATPGGVHVPPRPRFEDLLCLELEVWIGMDDGRIRRVRFATEHDHVDTVELWDFGVDVDRLDWAHLPTFRTPGEPSTNVRESASSPEV
jgi:hypothetical protein